MKIVSNDGTKANIKVTEAEVQQMIYIYERWIKTLCEENQQLKSVLNEAIEYLIYALDEEKETPSKHNDWRLDLLEIIGRSVQDETNNGR